MMKFSTANIKNADYTEQHVIYVGAMTGSVKRIDIFNEDSPYSQTNLQKLDSLTRDSKITALCWADEQENELLVGRGDSVIRTFDCTTNNFMETDLKIPQGAVAGFAWNNETLFAASDDGKIYNLNYESTTPIIETGDNISHMRQCQKNRSLIAAGGKERKNNLKVFDLESQKQIFTSKNVPHDSLELQVPVWDSDLSFFKNTENCLVTCSRHGYIRLYDTREQRRPIKNYVDNRDQAFNSIAERNGLIFVSTTTGGMYAFDLKNFKVPLHTYKGAVGSITSISVDESGKFLFSSSLDRYVRVHNVEKTNLLYQCYVKSKASQIVMKSADNILLNEYNKKKTEKAAESDQEYDEMFSGMQKVEEGSSSPKKRKIGANMKRHSGLAVSKKKK